jgi:hypothetical protein
MLHVSSSIVTHTQHFQDYYEYNLCCSSVTSVTAVVYTILSGSPINKYPVGLSQVTLKSMQLACLILPIVWDICHSKMFSEQCLNEVQHHQTWSTCMLLSAVAYPLSCRWVLCTLSCYIVLSVCAAHHEEWSVYLLLCPHDENCCSCCGGIIPCGLPYALEYLLWKVHDLITSKCCLICEQNEGQKGKYYWHTAIGATEKLSLPYSGRPCNHCMWLKYGSFSWTTCQRVEWAMCSASTVLCMLVTSYSLPALVSQMSFVFLVLLPHSAFPKALITLENVFMSEIQQLGSSSW